MPPPEAYGRPVTGTSEARPEWPARWALRVFGALVLAALVYGAVLVIAHVSLAGG